MGNFKFIQITGETIVPIGSEMQKGSIYAVVNNKAIWKKENIIKKILSILKNKWVPSETISQKIAKDISMDDIFGGKDDYGQELYELIKWHNSQKWDLTYLEKDDLIKSDSLDALTILTRMRYHEKSDLLNLNLAKRTPFICILAHPMVVKIPIISFQYFLDIHYAFSFNSIRQSKHINSDKLISYLYEILFIQQKIAISLHNFLRLTNHANKQKNKSLLINAEIDAIMNADLSFSYLKASIEKIIVFLGLIYKINNLSSLKTHKQKMTALSKKLPEGIKSAFYFKFIMEYISSENLDELNRYRTGLLHKLGISDLQPHNYVGKKSKKLPLIKIFNFIHEQHVKNTSVLIGVLALLTDELVNLVPPITVPIRK